MQVIHDVDVLTLLATALAAKRRPAELLEVIAGIDLINGNVPTESKLSEAFARLGENGLLVESEGGLALTAAAVDMIEQLSRKGDNAQHLFELKSLLAASKLAAGAALKVDSTEIKTAIDTHRAMARSGGKNLLVPKPKPEAAKARPGQRQRKPMPKRRSR